MRIRVTPKGGTFRNDLPSALLNVSSSPSSCPGAPLGQFVTSGNIRATLQSDARLLVQRVSDGQRLFRSAGPVGWGATTIAGLPFNSATLELDAPPDPVHGLGQHHDPTSRKYSLLPTNGETTVPLMHWPLAGASLLINVPSSGTLETKPSGVSWQSDACLQLDLWVAVSSGTSPSWPELMRKYVRATGQPASLPSWATGFIQSKDRYWSQEIVENVSASFEQRNLPLSMLIIGWQSWGPGPRGDERFGFDREHPGIPL